jgi:hypothetical protein
MAAPAIVRPHRRLSADNNVIAEFARPVVNLQIKASINRDCLVLKIDEPDT